MSFSELTVMNQMQSHLIEPANNGASWASGLWTVQEVVDYLNQRQYRFLKDTHLHVGLANVTLVNGTGTYNLPDDWINTIRVVILGTPTLQIFRADTLQADYGYPAWTTPSQPKLYTDVDTPPLTIRIMPTPNANGTAQVYYVPLSALLTGTGEIMTIPDEFVPFVKYGAMADMLRKVARAQDVRSDYCEQRYLMGIELGKLLLRGFR